jgi:hypothetical protein
MLADMPARAGCGPPRDGGDLVATIGRGFAAGGGA